MEKATKKIKVTLLKSTAGRVESVKATIEALGLKKIRSSNVLSVNPQIMGMIDKVKHLIKVEDVK